MVGVAEKVLDREELKLSVSFRLWVLLALIIGTLSGLAAIAGTGQSTQSAPRESTAPVSITPGADTGTGTGTEGRSSVPAQDRSSRTTIYAIIGAVVLAAILAVVLAAVGLAATGIIMRRRAGG